MTTIILYAVITHEGSVVGVVEGLAEAVSYKHQLQAAYNRTNRADEVFSVRPATPKEARLFGPS